MFTRPSTGCIERRPELATPANGSDRALLALCRIRCQCVTLEREAGELRFSEGYATCTKEPNNNTLL